MEKRKEGNCQRVASGRQARVLRPAFGQSGDLPVVDFKTQVCPACGSYHVRTRRSEKLTEETIGRRHVCHTCSAVFNSLQTIPLIDRPAPRVG